MVTGKHSAPYSDDESFLGISVPPLCDEFLVEIGDLARRLQKYFYLPVVIIGFFVSFGMILLLLDGYTMTTTYEKLIFPVTAIGFLMWMWSRKPQAVLFFVHGAFLVTLGLTVGSGLLYSLLWGRMSWTAPIVSPLPELLMTLWQIVWAAIVFLGTWVLGMKFLIAWRALKGLPASQVHNAIAEARERERLRKDAMDDGGKTEEK